MSAARLVFRVPRNTLQPYVVVSVAVHVAFAFFMIFFPGFGNSGTPPEDIIIAEIIAEVPAGPPPAPTKTVAPPPKTAPEPEPEGARIEPAEIKPPEKKVEKPKPEPPKPTTTAPPETEPKESPDAGAASGPGGDPDAAASGVVGVNLGALGHAWYRDSVAATLRRNWVRPVIESREMLEVTVAFEILRDGNVGNVRIASSSGVPSLDRSALRAVVDASPLPPLPASWREPSVGAQFLFRWLPGDE